MVDSEQIQALIPMILLLAAGVFAIALMYPLGLSPIIGYLIAGILIGPEGFRLIKETETTHLLAELGVVFLLFDIGLHFSLGKLWDVRRDILGLGPIQVGICAAGFIGFALMGGIEMKFAIVVGVALALSSTAVVIQTLVGHCQQDCPIGATATAVLIFQDICAIFLIILTSSLETVEGSIATVSGLAAVKALFAFGAAILIGRFLITPLFGLIAKLKNEEVFTAIALLLVLVTAFATGILGLSLTLGAFLAGMIISETPYRYIVQAEVKPFRGLLLGFFFITIGMGLHLEVLWNDWLQVLSFLFLLLTLKTVLIILSALLLRAPLRNAIQLGFLLSQGSEFAFVIFGMPAMEQGLGSGLLAVFITVIAASMAITPTLVSVGHRIATILANQDWVKQQSVDKARSAKVPPVIIFGMEKVGRLVGDALEAHNIRYTAIEMDYNRFILANADGYPVAFGDLADLRLMEAMGVSERLTIVVTIPRYEIAREISPIVAERYPHLKRFISVANEEEKENYKKLGLTAIVSHSRPEGLDMAGAVLKDHGVSDEAIWNWMQRHQHQTISTETDFQTVS